MKLLITGGCGFVGANTAMRFVNNGWEVVVIDNLSRKGSEVNAKLLSDRYGIRLITDVDIVKSAIKKTIINEKPEVIIHAAAQVAVTTSVEDPEFDFEVNAKGTLNVLEAARFLTKKPIFIFTSTNKVYGGMEKVSISEDDMRYKYSQMPFGVSENQNIDFHSPYGCSKGCAEQYVRDYFRIYGLPTIVFRQSCIYGLHQFGVVDQGWVSYLTMSAFFGKPINIYGDGKQVRDLLFMDDLSAAFQLAIENIDKTAGQIYNIGGGRKNTLSLREFLGILEEKIGKKIKFKFNKWRHGDQKVYISDIRKAENDFRWKPVYDFNVGFNKMFDFIETNKEALKDFV